LGWQATHAFPVGRFGASGSLPWQPTQFPFEIVTCPVCLNLPASPPLRQAASSASPSKRRQPRVERGGSRETNR
jgi:hypothetical protein